MKHGMKSLAVGMLIVAARCGAAERVACKDTADTWVAMTPDAGSRAAGSQSSATHGADPQLVIRGRESFALLNFDCSAAKGLTIAKAVLRIHREPDPVPLHTVGLSTVSGSGQWADASATMLSPGAGLPPWSYPGSDLVDVTFGQGGSLYTYQRARDAGDGWYEVEVPPALVHALITGDQYGWMLDDEKGQTQTRHVLSSREGAYPPELIVEGAREDRTAPGGVRNLKTGSGLLDSGPEEARKLGRSTLRPGSVILHFGGAGDDKGTGVAARYELRYSPQRINAANFSSAAPAPRWSLDPLVPKPHPLAISNALRDEVFAVVEQLKPGENYYFAARATDEAGNSGPVSPLGRYRAYSRAFPALAPLAAPAHAAGSTQPAAVQVWAVSDLLKIDPTTGALLEPADEPGHRSANAVWNATTSTVSLSGARNEFVAFQLAIESAGPLSGVEVTVAKPLFADNKLPEVFRNPGAIQLYREWFVPDDRNTGPSRPWYPDPLVPLNRAFDLPARDNAVPGQTVQPLFVDIYIPHDARPGLHSGGLLVRAPGLEREITLNVDVLPLRLPDQLNFVVDLNCYSSVASGYDVRRGTPEYRALVRSYHRLAHLNRTNLDILGYSQRGTVEPDNTPVLEGEGAATRAVDWSDWDAHFGPLLDGSAFADLPRARVPIPAMYLPFFENWPGDMRRGYKFNDAPIAKTQQEYQQIVTRHALEASPVEEAFTRDYQDRFTAVAAQFAAHIRERGWMNTKYLVYFNNKYYFRRPEQGGISSSWWLLDEPNHRDDVRATGFLGYLLKQGTSKYPDVPILLRTDISRVEWIRDLLAGQIDLNCISGQFFRRNRYLQDDHFRFGRQYWNYASTNHPRETNVSMRAWCWRVWLAGGNGLLPWNAVRGAQAWDRAEPLTVFYPGAKFGKNEPFPSLRLKAYRRGQQDVEYLVLLAQKQGWDRDAVSHAVAQALDLSPELRQRFEEDAGTINFRNVRDSELDKLRRQVAQTLMSR